MRATIPLSLAATLACAACSPSAIVDGTADLTFRLDAPARVVEEQRAAIVEYQQDEGGGIALTVVDDAGSDPCSLFVGAAGQDLDVSTTCVLATPVGQVAVALTKASVPTDASKPLTLAGALAGGAGSMTLSFSGTPRR